MFMCFSNFVVHEILSEIFKSVFSKAATGVLGHSKTLFSAQKNLFTYLFFSTAYGRVSDPLKI
eukprot:snap_masked-scaffold_11-processed-gene-3.11-mRNA-1 protein AED:1.00 eAED:1.00 QI:0/0/0/0/1/1/2/0/62